MIVRTYNVLLCLLMVDCTVTEQNAVGCPGSSENDRSRRFIYPGQHGESHNNEHGQTYTIGSFQVELSGRNYNFILKNKLTSNTLTGILAQGRTSTNIQVKPYGNSALDVQFADDAHLNLRAYKSHFANCVDVTWKAVRCVSEIFTDCIHLGDSHWYGGAELTVQQWPIEKLQRAMKPFLAMEMFGDNETDNGAIQERMFFNSDGFGMYVDEDVPLFVSINASGDRSICLQAQYDDYWYLRKADTLPNLKYTICSSSDVKNIHRHLMDSYIKFPGGTPHPDLFRYPIWSTWAEYKVNINQSLVLDFVRNIQQHNFSISQIEIDDNWTPRYGDLDFDRTTFPDPKGMIDSMHMKNIPVTLWVHPFVNMDAKAFPYLAKKGWMIRDALGHTPALISWWNGKTAGHIDFSNPDAEAWFRSELYDLMSNCGVDSFKFDAGDVNYIPPSFKAHKQYSNRNVYARYYAETASGIESAKRMEVRVGVKTQDLPVMVRTLDKFSTWDLNNGLKSVITSGLLFGILGYPFYLPDYIGGNGYDIKPDPELYIRWVQATALLPVMQFSITPWSFRNSTVLEISQEMVQLHEKYSSLIIQLAKQAVATGFPIIRPLWWIAPTDKSALTVDDQFLLGNDLLVAPVVNKGETNRRMYLPVGRWRDELKGHVHDGGKWIDYHVTLWDIPHFSRVTK